MKRLIITAVCICSLFFAKAQTLSVKSVEELSNDISARTMARVDENNNPCAILRINAPTIENLQFDESVVGEVKYLPGEYIAYIKPDATALSYSCKGENTTVNFSEYGIKIEGKKSYRIILGEDSSHQAEHAAQAYITANYDNVIVLVDGVPMGETPVLIESIEPGRHTISIPNTAGVTMPDMIVDIAENSRNNIELNLYQEERKPVKVEYYNPEGFDSSKLHATFGIIVVRKGDKVGLVDYTGEELVPCIFDSVREDEKYLDYYRVAIKDVDNNWKYGLYAPRKGLVRPCVYDKLDYVEFIDGTGYITCWKDDKCGLLDANLNEILPVAFSAIQPGKKILARLENDQWSMYDNNGNLLKKTIQEGDISLENEGYCLFNDHGIEGVLALDGKRTYLPSKYFLGDLRENVVSSGLFKVQDIETDKWGFMDTNLNMVFPAIFDVLNGWDSCVYNFVKGIVKVKLNGHEVILNNKGDIIIDSQKQGLSRIDILADNGSLVDFENYHRFMNHYWENYSFENYSSENYDFENYGYENYNFESLVIKVSDNQGKQGVYDVSGKIIVPCGIYDDVSFYKYNNKVYYICLQKDADRCDILGADGGVIKMLPMDGYTLMTAYVHNEDICYVRGKNTGQLQFLARDFNTIATLPEGFVINFYKDGIFQITDGKPQIRGKAYLDTSYGYINIKGKMIANCVYGYGGGDSNTIGGKVDMIARLIYEAPISDGLALLAIGDRYGYVDIEGKVVTPLIYKAVTPFDDGVAYALGTDDKWSKIYRKDL